MNTIQKTLDSVDIPYIEAEILLAYLLKKDVVYLKTHLDELVDGRIKNDYLKLAYRRKAGEPIAYLIRQKNFLDCILKVNKNVLIPRFETESLVEWIIEDNKKYNLQNLLEIGTGSGCIAICLAKHLNLKQIIATDISESALRLAEKNSKKIKLKLNLLNQIY